MMPQEITAIRARQSAVNALRIAIIRKYGKTQGRMIAEASEALEDRARAIEADP